MSNPWDTFVSTLGQDVAIVENYVNGLLASSGMSYLEKDIPEIYTWLENQGVSQPLVAIEDAIKEIVAKGPKKALEDALNGLMKPITDPINAAKPSKQRLLSSLQYHSDSIHTSILNLTTSGGFEGEAATTLAHTNKVLQGLASDIQSRMSASHAADEALIASLGIIAGETATELVVAEVILVIILAIGVVALAQGGLNLPNDIIAAIAIPLGAIVIGAAAVSILILAAIEVKAAIDAWTATQKQLQEVTIVLLETLYTHTHHMSIPVDVNEAHITDLPIGAKVVVGGRMYIPPKSGHGKAVSKPHGKGFVDAQGNVWEWAQDQHAGPHWDVQHPNGDHTNVAADGTVIGKDYFPNGDSLKKP